MLKREEPLRLTLVEIPHKSACKVVRIEVLQVVHALTHANLQHRKLKLVAHGKRDAALRRTVELGDDDAVEGKRVVELAPAAGRFGRSSHR